MENGRCGAAKHRNGWAAYASGGLSGSSSRRTRMATNVTSSASTVAAAPMVSAASTPAVRAWWYRGLPASAARPLYRSTVGRVLVVAHDDTSIKVSAQTRERLARLAAERNTTLKELVGDLAAGTPTKAELCERERRSRAVLAEFFGVEVTDAELAASARLREMIARRETAA
jgi:hypothetical protein